MKYTDALKQLRTKQLKSIYLIAGEELYLAEKYLKELLHLLNPTNDPEAVQYFDGTCDIKALLQALDSAPFFSERNIIIAKDLKIFHEKNSSDKDAESLFLAFLDNIPDYSVLILQNTTKVDKRKKIIKTIDKKGIIVECETIAHWNIGDWLAPRLKELNLQFDKEAYAYFVEAVKAMDKVSLGFLDQELQKLTLYGTQTVINRQFLEKNLASIPEISTFRLWDAIADKDIALALELYLLQEQAGVYPLRLLKFFVRQVTQLWHVKIYLQERQSVRDIANILKLHPFITEKIVKQAKTFSLPAIEQMLIDLSDADYKIKTGSNEPALMENILIRFCS